MIYSHSERFSIKQTSRDRSKQWRDRFQQQCRDRIQSARWNKVDQRRQEKVCIYMYIYINDINV